jgi:hypothetical protein
MAQIGLLFKRRVRLGLNASAEILPAGAVELDASLTENHTSRNEVTRFPVEKGVDTTDHVRRQPDSVTIRGVVSDHPITFGGGGANSRSAEAYQDVLTMLNEAQLINVVTTLREYDNMVIESLSVPRNPRRGNTVEFNLTLTEIKTVEVQVAEGTIDKGTQIGTAL